MQNSNISEDREESPGVEPLEPRWLLSFTTLPNGLPDLNSNPSAPVSTFIDLESFAGGFSLDGDPSTFNADEQASIYHAWRQAATAYSPFDINVTTVAPDASTPFSWVGIGNDGPSGGSGTRYFRIWADQDASPTSKMNSYRLPSANTIIHENNHGLGIGHSFYYDDNKDIIIAQYVPGERRAAWTTAASSMGEFKNGLSQYGRPDNPAGYYWQIKDLEIISRAVINATQTYVDPSYAGDGFRPDDHGDDIGSATLLTFDGGVFSADGIIERLSDKDVFLFNWSGGEAWIGGQASLPRAQLDVQLSLLDASGNLIAHADPDQQWDAGIHIENLPAGSYYVEVSSDGDYSDLGSYRATAGAARPQFFLPSVELDFNESPGATTFVDASPYGNNGQLQGSVNYVAGQDGSGALDLNGNDRILITEQERSLNKQYNELATTADGLTFSLRFKADNVNATGKQVLIDAFTNKGITAYIENGELKVNAYRAAGSISPELSRMVSTNAVSSNQWHHLTITHYQTMAHVDGALRIYLDGVLVDQIDAIEVPEIGSTISLGDSSGSVRFHDGNTSHTGFSGVIDDFHFYHEVLPEHMIAALADQPTLHQPAPTGPAIAGSATTTANSAQLNWNALGGATGYEILRSEDGQNYKPVATVGAGATSYEDTGLESSHRYFYAVNALGASGVASMDAKTRAGEVILANTIDVEKLTADPDFQWTDFENWGHHAEGIYGITINWIQAQGDEDLQVRVERSLDGVNFTPLRTLPATSTVYYDNTVQPNTIYTYKLVTIDSLGDAAEITFTAGSTGAGEPPTVVQPIADVTVAEDAPDTTVDLLPIFDDIQVTPLTYTVTGNTNPSLVSASITGSTLTLDYSPSGLGTADITIRATDDDGLFVEDTFTVQVTTTGQNSLGLFTDSQDIGNPQLTGSASEIDGSYTVLGGGSDIYNNADQFHFVHRELNGDVDIRARVDFLQETDEWAKAGLMIRNGTSANAAHAMVLQRPDNQVAWQWRTNNGGSVGWNGNLQGGTGQVKWLRLTRVGDEFTGYYSTDGSSWTPVGSSKMISMSADVEVGLAVTSHDNSLLATANFSDVVIIGLNNPPIAVTDHYGIIAGQPTVLHVLDNDSDSDNDTLAIDSFTQPANGAVINNGDGTLTITANPAAVGPDAFEYTVTDGNGGFDTVAVTLSIINLNVPPTVENPIADIVTNDSYDRLIDISDVFDDFEGKSNLVYTVSGNTNPALVTPSLNGTDLVLDLTQYEEGVATITIRATDQAGVYVEDSFDLTKQRLLGDTDFDGDIDTVDLSVSILNYTGPGGTGKTYREGDTDADGDVDTLDLTTTISAFTGATADMHQLLAYFDQQNRALAGDDDDDTATAATRVLKIEPASVLENRTDRVS